MPSKSSEESNTSVQWKSSFMHQRVQVFGTSRYLKCCFDPERLKGSLGSRNQKTPLICQHHMNIQAIHDPYPKATVQDDHGFDDRQVSNEKKRPYFPLLKSWLVDRDPYNGLWNNPHITGQCNPLYTLNNRFFCIAQVISVRIFISTTPRIYRLSLAQHLTSGPVTSSNITFATNAHWETDMDLGLSPFPVTVTTRIITFLVGNPDLNLHFHYSWEEGQPNMDPQKWRRFRKGICLSNYEDFWYPSVYLGNWHYPPVN